MVLRPIAPESVGAVKPGMLDGARGDARRRAS
jgi:hypothetical protein